MSIIVVDPMMFAISEGKLIESNLEFYLILFELIEKRKIKICLYPEAERLLEGIQEDGLYFPPPFPIDLRGISDPETKEICNKINYVFVSKLVNHQFFLDVEECGGEQNYILNTEYEDDRELQNLGAYLLTNCYSSRPEEETICNKIASGKDVAGKMLRLFPMNLRCSCNRISNFEDRFDFVWPDIFRSSRDAAIAALQKMYMSQLFGEYRDPSLLRDGDHHVYFQDKPPSKFSELSRANKSVLKHLPFFGLSKVHFHDTKPGTAGRAGDIIVSETFDPHQPNSVVEGWMTGEKSSSVKVEMFFPQNVGGLIVEAIGKTWTPDNIRELKMNVVV